MNLDIIDSLNPYKPRSEEQQDDQQGRDASNDKKLLQILSKIIIEQVDAKVSEVKQKLTSEIATLRTETYYMQKEVQKATQAIEACRLIVANEVKRNKQQCEALMAEKRAEDKAASLLGDDTGILTTLGDTLALARKCSDDSDPAELSKNVQRFLGRCIWPLSNRLVSLSHHSTSAAAETEADIDNMEIEQLLQLSRVYQEKLGEQKVGSFNRDLLRQLMPVLNRMASAEFEGVLESDPVKASAEIAQAVEQLQQVVRANGIAIVDEPEGEWAKYFVLPNADHQPHPLIIRISDNLVYAPGVSAEADPAVSIY